MIEAERWHARVLALAALLLAPAAVAATLTLGLVQRGDDERLDPRRVEQAYPGQPGGTFEAALQMAVNESQFELDAAKLAVKVEVRSVRDAADAKVQLAALAKAGLDLAFLRDELEQQADRRRWLGVAAKALDCGCGNPSELGLIATAFAA